MSAALAYPPSHSSSRPPSSPDIHRNNSSSNPRNYPTIAAARPPSSLNPNQNTMSSSSPSCNTPITLAPRPSPRASAEHVRPDAPSASAPVGVSSERPSPKNSTTLQQEQPAITHDDTTEPTSSHTVVPSVEVKTERATTPETSQPAPAPPTRHRPKKLDLTTNMSSSSGRPSAPMTSKDSAPLTAMQEVGLMCLSPGFQTEDPRMSQQLQRSMDLREQQRQIIEARMQKGGRDVDSSLARGPLDHSGPQSSTFSKPPGTSKRKGPPPGLTITAPSAQQFASEPRVIQSAPLHQSFTGLNNKPGSSNIHPLARQIHEGPRQHRRLSNQPPSAIATSSSSQQYAPHIATPQTATRLPSIQDVFGNENLATSPYRPSHTLNRANSGPGGSTGVQMYAPLTATANNANRSPNAVQHPGSLPSPAYPTAPRSAGLHPPSHSYPTHDRDFRSADEAVHAMAGGREELLPKIVHYGGHQPPTPPSPLPPFRQNHSGERPYHGPSSLKAEAGAEFPRSASGRRRTRDEYERDYNDRQGRDVDRMDIDAENERGRNAAPSKGTAEGIASSIPGGLGFGFGAWSSQDNRRRSPETIRRKKEEFLELCARAWDLMHE